MNRWQNLTIALAGITQAVSLMDKLAKTGQLNNAEFEVCVKSILDQNPTDTESIYGGYQNLSQGYEVLVDLLQKNRGPQQTSLISYCLGVLHLQKRLNANKMMLNTVGERLTKAQHQVEHFGHTHENVIANLAGIYTDTISTFPFRIQVIGDHQYLQQPRIANQIRVLLLCAIRSAMLWRQLGGTRWHFIFQRQKLMETAEQLFNQAKQYEA